MAKDLRGAFEKWHNAQPFSGMLLWEAYKAGAQEAITSCAEIATDQAQTPGRSDRIRAGLVLDGKVQIPEWMPREEPADCLKDLDDIAAGLLKVAGKPPNEYLLGPNDKRK